MVTHASHVPSVAAVAAPATTIAPSAQLLRDKGVTFFRELKGELGEFRDREGNVTEPDHIVYLVSLG